MSAHETAASSLQPPPTLTAQAFWLTAARTLAYALSVVQPMLLVRLFAQLDYGTYKQAFVIIATGGSILSMGINISAFYFLPRERGRRAQIPVNIALYNLSVGATAFIVLALYPHLLSRIVTGSQLVPYARLMGLVILLSIFSSLLETIATALRDIKWSSIFIVSSQLSKVTIMTVAAIWWRSVEVLLYGAALQGILQSIVLLIYLYRRFGRFWRGFSISFFWEQLGYAIPYGLYGVLTFAQGDLHNYFVAQSVDPAVFAVYSVGCVQIPFLGLLRNSITDVLLSRTSELQHQGRTREVMQLTIRAMQKTALVYLPAAALFLVVGREFITFLFTPLYAESTKIFLANLAMLPLSVIVTDHIIRAYPEHRFFIIRVRGCLLALQCVLLWFAVHRFGMMGAVLTLVSVTALDRAIVAWKTARIVGMGATDLPLLLGVVKIAGVSAICALCVWLMRLWLEGLNSLVILAVCGSSFGFIFVIICLRLRLISDADLGGIRPWMF
jgi:O-antigen/teichoic acid export membrane protein